MWRENRFVTFIQGITQKVVTFSYEGQLTDKINFIPLFSSLLQGNQQIAG
jgi:hypothetical protein